MMLGNDFAIYSKEGENLEKEQLKRCEYEILEI